MAQQAPPDVTTSDAERLAGPQAHMTGTLRWLNESGAFESVRLGSVNDPDADLAAESTGDYCNMAIVPIWTILSLGVVPTIFTDTECQGAILRLLRGPHMNATFRLEHRSSSKSIMGWLAVPIGGLPGCTHGSRTHTRQYRERARLEILDRTTVLAALAPLIGELKVTQHEVAAEKNVDGPRALRVRGPVQDPIPRSASQNSKDLGRRCLAA